MDYFFVLYEDKLGFLAKEESHHKKKRIDYDNISWTFRLDKAYQFATPQKVKEFLQDRGYIGYMLKFASIRNAKVVELAGRDRRNKKYIKVGE